MLLLMFRVMDGCYAVSADRVVEVVPRVELHAVPHAPGALAGLFQYRGKVVPVIDLSLLLGGPACPSRLSTRIIVVNRQHEGTARREWLGLVAEQVNDVRRFAEGTVVAPLLKLGEAPYFGSVVQAEEGIVQLIEVDRVLTGSLVGVLPGGPTEEP